MVQRSNTLWILSGESGGVAVPTVPRLGALLPRESGSKGMIPLLVSVRSPVEAQLALRAGAALIDVKEPARGSLGRADDALIAGVVRAVAGRRTVSAALGELVEYPAPPQVEGLSFVKWGLAGTNGSDWRKELCDACRRLQRVLMSSRPVAV